MNGQVFQKLAILLCRKGHDEINSLTAELLISIPVNLTVVGSHPVTMNFLKSL